MSPLGIISLLTFCFLVVLCECFYRRTNRKADMVVATPGPDTKVGENKIMAFTIEQIDKGVEAGLPLLIFDNLVLNLNGYEKLHPGGKFVFKQNFGRDISKFFNGGYSLVQSKGVKPHHHSAHALKILKGLIVGVLQEQQ